MCWALSDLAAPDQEIHISAKALPTFCVVQVWRQEARWRELNSEEDCFLEDPASHGR
jgi:hypothetical protein